MERHGALRNASTGVGALKGSAYAPLVSIVMPCFNGAEHLPMSVGSVMAQTFSDWELFVVDDGSTDGSFEWLQTQADPRLRVVRQTNQGVSAARNAGIARASAPYMAFLDADDTWAPAFLESMVAALRRHPKAVLAYCGWQNLGLSGGRGQPFVPPDYEIPAKRETLFAGCRWPVHAVLVRHEALRAAGGFNTALKNAEDYALWLEVAGTAPIVRVPQILAFYHFHGSEQASSNKARGALQLLDAQKAYLRRHPDFASLLGWAKRREIIYGTLLRTAFETYWNQDLITARTLFRRVMASGYGSPKSWFYMLPALLPLSLHILLLRARRLNRTDT